MTCKYDWLLLQQEHDNGLSHSQLYFKFGVSPRALRMASLRGDFKSRARHEATLLHNLTKVPTKHTAEFKESQRDKIVARYKAGWMPKAGRCKKFTHISPIAGTVLVDGTWELKVAKWLDEQHYNWKRNIMRFQYTNLSGKISHYTPDFWVEELNGYLEIKGYETALDRCKWSQFNESLVVWKREELTSMNII